MCMVLIADDEADIREILCDAVREAGFTVIAVGDGLQAIGILASVHVDLLITDIQMPGFDGIQLTAQAKMMRPDLSIIYMTGYAHLDNLAGEATILHKPFLPSRLIEIIRQDVVRRRDSSR
jgi:DNA-binding NtrC family response regulator